MRKRTSVVWSISKQELIEIVKNNDSLSKILKYFNLNNKGGNSKTLKRRLDEEKIDYSHIRLGAGSNKGRIFIREKIPLEEIMVENSTYNRVHLKSRLIKNGMLENECVICGLKSEWQNKNLVMVLDHINGVSNDHRKENLRLLCPNCNSQTPTFAGKKNKILHYCKECKKEKTYKYSKLCNICSNKQSSFKRRKVKNRPSQEQLLKDVKELGYCGTGRKYNVSDNAIRKWII